MVANIIKERGGTCIKYKSEEKNGTKCTEKFNICKLRRRDET